VSDIWNWANQILAPNIIVSNWYTGLSVNQSFLINDFSSVIFGYAILKQKRIKSGKFLFDYISIYSLAKLKKLKICLLEHI